MFVLHKEDIKIILYIDILIVCILDVLTTYGSCLILLRLPVVLCALHEPDYNLKAVGVATIIYLNNCYVFRFYNYIIN